jgi:hypothetical protein
VWTVARPEITAVLPGWNRSNEIGGRQATAIK